MTIKANRDPALTPFANRNNTPLDDEIFGDGAEIILPIIPEEPHCSYCGEEKNLAYLDQYANGEHWKCKECDQTFMFSPPPKEDEYTDIPKPMTPEEITRQKAEKIYEKHLSGQWVDQLSHNIAIEAITEALNTINWIPIDADKLPDGEVLCGNIDTRIKLYTSLYNENGQAVAYGCNDQRYIITHYAHVNLP
jgi:hypothetical protein